MKFLFSISVTALVFKYLMLLVLQGNSFSRQLVKELHGERTAFLMTSEHLLEGAGDVISYEEWEMGTHTHSLFFKCISWCLCVPWDAWGGQRTTGRSWSSPFSMWVLKLSSGHHRWHSFYLLSHFSESQALLNLYLHFDKFSLL